jgi:hypothetical protein
MKVTQTEAIAATAPRKSKLLFLESLKELRKVSNDHGIPLGRSGTGNSCGTRLLGQKEWKAVTR